MARGSQVWRQGSNASDAVPFVHRILRGEMKKRKRVKLIQEGRYLAEVDVEFLEDETGWSPYLSSEDAHKLNDVRDALRRGDIRSASSLARVFELRPVASQ